MAKPNYSYTLKLLMRGIEPPLLIDLRENEYQRLKHNLDDQYFDSTIRKFFNCNSIDGKLYSINLKLLQSVHFLWDPVPSPLDEVRYDGLIEVCLFDRKETVTIDTDNPNDAYDFFWKLESDTGDAFAGITDVDGEYIAFQLSEIVYAICPNHIYEEGMKMEEDD